VRSTPTRRESAFIENQISGQLVQTASRMLHEEVTFNKTNVTSLDWNSYPICDLRSAPRLRLLWCSASTRNPRARAKK